MDDATARRCTARVFKRFSILYGPLWASGDLNAEVERERFTAWVEMFCKCEIDVVVAVMEKLLKGDYPEYYKYPPKVLEFLGLTKKINTNVPYHLEYKPRDRVDCDKIVAEEHLAKIREILNKKKC